MGTIFTRDPKPLEVEILVVEVGETPAQMKCIMFPLMVRSQTAGCRDRWAG